jgi:hypothetical protein
MLLDPYIYTYLYIHMRRVYIEIHRYAQPADGIRSAVEVVCAPRSLGQDAGSMLALLRILALRVAVAAQT